MTASFSHVGSITTGILTLIVVFVVTLDVVGIAKVKIDLYTLSRLRQNVFPKTYDDQDGQWCQREIIQLYPLAFVTFSCIPGGPIRLHCRHHGRYCHICHELRTAGSDLPRCDKRRGVHLRRRWRRPTAPCLPTSVQGARRVRGACDDCCPYRSCRRYSRMVTFRTNTVCAVR